MVVLLGMVYWVFFDGDFFVGKDVCVLVFDCGFLFVYVVYEVIVVYDGKFIDFDYYMVCFWSIFVSIEIEFL